MKIPDEVRKTIAFIGYQNKTNGETVSVGSMFFLGHDPAEGTTTSPRVYAVTARHIISGLRAKGLTEGVLRLNSNVTAFKNVNVPLDNWFVHPSDKTIDVAIFEMGIPSDTDHLVIATSMCATKAKFAEHEVALGDEVIISGLFRHHVGTKRNIPIIRVGNLSALDEEKITTREYGEIDGYLIEARSIGGLSGSPVFLNLGIVRNVGGQIKYSTRSAIILLLGLIHGHYDVDQGQAAGNHETVNAGIAIVVPIESILSVISEYEERNPESPPKAGTIRT